MLYFSRYVKCSDIVRYGVVDTDDGFETLVNWDSLSDLVLNTGLHIKGVHRYDEYGIKVRVYQPPEETTRLQVKTKTLKGVDVTIYNHEIVGVRFDASKIHSRVTIRLSDFANSLGDYILGECPKANVGIKVVLVLDNSVLFHDYAFKTLRPATFEELGVILDMRELDDEHAIKALYMLFKLPSGTAYILDKPERADVINKVDRFGEGRLKVVCSI